MSSSSDATITARAISRLRKAFESQGIPFPGPEFWSKLEHEIATALRRNDEREGPVRRAIEEWIRSKLLRDPTFVVDDSLKTYEDVAVELELTIHKESRTAFSTTSPYRRQTKDAVVEEIWDRPTTERFKSGKSTWTRGGTGEIIGCNRCGRSGKHKCEPCSGDGFQEVRCEKCGGAGEISREDKVVGATAKSVGGAIVLRKEQCQSCRGNGKLEKRCASCKGKGEVTCTVCAGTRDLWRYEYIRQEVTLTTAILQVRPDIAMDERWITRAPRSRFMTESSFDVDANNGRELAPAFTNARPMFERVSAAVVPITIGVFEWRGRERKAYLVDGEPYSHETGAFLGKRRVAAALAILSVALASGGWFGYTAIRNSERTQATPLTAVATRAVVTTPVANIRERPSAASSVMGRVPRGDSLDVTGPAIEGWTPVRTTTAVGFIRSDLISQTRP